MINETPKVRSNKLSRPRLKWNPTCSQPPEFFTNPTPEEVGSIPDPTLEETIHTLNPLISCLSRQYSGLYLSPTLPTLLPASDIPDQCTIGGLLHNYSNPPPADYFHIFPPIHSILRP